MGDKLVPAGLGEQLELLSPETRAYARAGAFPTTSHGSSLG